ncbi:aminotransferase class IV [Candidatus Poriferisocius sp.]|uniref:aminotransferase class IV n=1 Tax=Candidatus Poriferisocius sp. TaxID=3101276 RepID=UPI003B012E96
MTSDNPMTSGDMTSGNPRIVWFNGSLLAEDQVRISPFDHGWLVGDAVFETLTIVRGMPFAARRHLERLNRSAEPLGIAVPDTGTLREAMISVATANGLREGRLRITVSSGTGPLGSDRGTGPPTVTVAAGEQTPWPLTTAVATVDWTINERGPLAGLKTVSYGANVRALASAKAVGAGEAVLANTRGMLCEGTGSNVFLVHQGRLITPSLASGCLAGITRQLVMELTGATEQDVPIGMLASAGEAFLTSTTRDVQGIHAVDGHPMAPAPGPITIAAAQAFAELKAGNLDP